MASTRNKTVVAVFENRGQADQAVNELLQAGFRDDQIGVIGPDGKNKRGSKIKKETGTHVAEGAIGGAVAGAGVGGLVGLGLLAGIIPPLGPAIAGGTLAMILANAAGGAAIAGVAGALIGLGIPEEEAKYYETELKAGRFLVTVQANSRRDEVMTILRRHGGHDMHDRSATAPAGRTSRKVARETSAADEKSMELREEQLRARKTPVNKGEVRVRKDVVTEQKTIKVPVTREEVVVERRPAGGRRATSTIKEGEEIRIPVKAEEVRVDKDTVVKEEVKVGKRRVQETKNVSGTVRKERAAVEPSGNVTVRNESSTRARR